MATLDDLVAAGLLRRVTLRLGRKEYDDRQFFGSAAFLEWLHGPVMSAVSFYPDDIAPKLQAHALLKDFITGKPFCGTRLFKKMSPASDDVWELRSPDIRVFGWFPRKDCYVATSGDLFGNLKGDPPLYEKHRIDCVSFRSEIQMTEPMYVAGANENDVVSE